MTITRIEDEMRRAWFRREVLPREKMLRAYARRFRLDGPDGAEDIVHDVFVKAISYERWAEIENVDAFLRRVMRNILLDELRRRKLVAFDAIADLDLLDMPDDAPSSESVAIWRDQLRALHSIINELSPRARQVLLLRRVDGLSTRDIAERLGISVSTVEKHLTAGLRYCTEALARDSDGQARATRRSLWVNRRNIGAKR